MCAPGLPAIGAGSLDATARYLIWPVAALTWTIATPWAPLSTPGGHTGISLPGDRCTTNVVMVDSCALATGTGTAPANSSPTDARRPIMIRRTDDIANPQGWKWVRCYRQPRSGRTHGLLDHQPEGRPCTTMRPTCRLTKFVRVHVAPVGLGPRRRKSRVREICPTANVAGRGFPVALRSDPRSPPFARAGTRDCGTGGEGGGAPTDPALFLRGSGRHWQGRVPHRAAVSPVPDRAGQGGPQARSRGRAAQGDRGGRAQGRPQGDGKASGVRALARGLSGRCSGSYAACPQPHGNPTRCRNTALDTERR